MIAGVLIDILVIFGFITNIPENVLALTILSWGGSLGDIMTIVHIAKKGYAEMAVTGCIAEPLFNMLFGFGAITLILQK